MTETTTPAEGLRERLTEIFLNWESVRWEEDTPNAEQINEAVDRALTAIAVDHGNLPARFADAILDLPSTVLPDERHRDHRYAIGCPVCKGDVPAIVRAVMGVRDELMVSLGAQLAQALRRAEHAEGELSSRRDHETRWELERQKREEAEKLLDAAGQDIERLEDRLRKAEGAYARLDAEKRDVEAVQDRWKARAEQAEAAIERVRAAIAGKTWPSAMVRAESIRAALDGGE